MNSLIKSTLTLALRGQKVAGQVRFYPRWSHRRPVKVYTSEEFEEIQANPGGKLKKKVLKEELKAGEDEVVTYNVKRKKKSIPLVATNQGKSKTTDMLETIIDSDGNFIYEKLKNNDGEIGILLTQLKSKKLHKSDLILLEGKRLIKEALQANCKLKYMLFSRKSDVEDIKPFLPKIGAKICKMPYNEIQMWSDLTTSPGIMGIFQTPDMKNVELKNSLPITVICDNIREPGNLGAVLRICAGVGCDNVILTKGCVNVWDSKVLRSAIGAHFKLRIETGVKWSDIEENHRDSAIFIADNKVLSEERKLEEKDDKTDDFNLEAALQQIPLVPYYSFNFKDCDRITLIVGGETLGISRDSYKLASKTNGIRLNIPMSNDVDSVNVASALGVIAFEMKKQLAVSN